MFSDESKVNRHGAKTAIFVSTQHGFGLPLAIFVMTILASLAVMMSGLVNDNMIGRTDQANLVRAMMVAQSGAGLALNQMFPPSDSPEYQNTTCPASFTFSNIDITADPGMASCSLTVGCAAVGVSPNTMYVVTSKGTCDGVSRSIQVDAR